MRSMGEGGIDMNDSRILLALDGKNPAAFDGVLAAVAGEIAGVKVGLQMLNFIGPDAVSRLRNWGFETIFLDGKLYDIPNTVGGASDSLRHHSVDIFNVAAACGLASMRAAVANRGSADVYAVTVLTSMTEEDCQLTHGRSIRAQVLHFAQMAQLAGVQGVICSAQHLKFLRDHPELDGLKYITPGVRSPGAAANDQKQIDTPVNAITNGAAFVVIGREVTEADDPLAAVRRINLDIQRALL